MTTSNVNLSAISTASNSKVQRFMVLGSARTGSNLLLSLLSAHPHIKTYGELFNLDMLPETSLLEVLDNPITFLQRRVYQDHKLEIAAAGFKMFYDHLTRDYFTKLVDMSDAAPQLQEKYTRFSSFIESNYAWEILDERFRTTWHFLRAEQSLAVIHLQRRNMLHTLISLKQAYMTSQWWSLKSSPQAMRQVHLDPVECCRYFEKLNSSAAEADAAFAEHPKINVIHEDLIEKQQDTMQRIFAFLKVPYEPVTTRMKKQNLASPQETVNNYEQLKSYFRNTRWDVFFE
ncbi:MAG TPA: sulfotransferase [Candidatus Angelobacter sp.]|nr:sulfotransferase [Candidatus Angelobacter sp.]